ncbi:Polyamine aminopropyltransferase [Achromobacter veterisilvae]|uniref:Polyamine aminopropyltransferase n=1 Tax=Achromobacter veterisilvae TaxID=2069367 RepID=A0A446C3B4_9BURK|nr:fused MFS/spermidine synthase [Achromobacter veterisilvae]SSW62313.1 Polyamine aminopropyltransferase [Achromobacter veterisilvae]
MSSSLRNMPAQASAGTRARPAVGLWAPAGLLVFSGAAALIFQILWIKQLSLIVGVEVHAIAVAVSAFFFGLALGSAWLGRLADRSARPLRLYAGIELGVALLALGVTWALAHGGPLFARAEQAWSWLAWLAMLAVVAIPPILMGGTLPVLLRACGAGQVGRAGGVLYAANTAGAIAGALLPAFVLIPAYGVFGTACVAAGLNLAAAAGAWALQRQAPAAAREASADVQALSSEAWLAIGLYSAAGAIAMGYEVLWSQMVVPFMSTRTFAFSVVLAVYLAGLALGAALYARWERRFRDPWRIFALLIAGAGVAALLEVALLGPWLIDAQSLAEAAVRRWSDSGLAGMSARFAVVAAVVVLVPTLLLGAAFPAVLRIAVPPARRGQGAGLVLAGNTLGGIAGTLVVAFVLLPRLGTVRSLVLLAAAACAIGIAAAWRSPAPMARAVSVALLGSVLILGWALPSDHLARLLPGAKDGKLVFYEESQGGTVAVVERGAGERRFRRLYIQGVSNSGDAMPSLRYMRLQALLPLIVHAGEPRSALVIGYGTGITAGALSRYPGLDRRVVAELLPGVLRAGALFQGSFGAADDPGLDRRLRDGRRELLASQERYDLITLEPPPPSAAGVVNLYSRDFYQLAAARLNPQGVVAQWLPLPTQNLDDTRALVASFIAVFPHATLWTTELHEMLLIGSLQPMPLDAGRITGRMAQPRLRQALADVGVGSPAALLATWVTDREGLARFAGDAPPVTDDRPAIEYAAWVRPREIVRTLPALLALRGEPPLGADGPALSAEVENERGALDLFYRSALAAYRGNREEWAGNAGALAQLAQANPYLRWFMAGTDSR